MAKLKQIRIYKLPVISFVSSWCLTQGRCRWVVLKKQLLPDCNSFNLPYCADDRVRLTRKLLEKKESLIKEIDDYGWTPLHYAAYYGCLPVTRILLECDKSATCIADKSRKMTPLLLAASQGHIGTIKEIILYCPECYELVDDREWNALHFAMVSLSKKELCSLLGNPSIKKLVHEKDAKGNTPLHVLATCIRSMGWKDPLSDIIDQVRGDGRCANKQNISVEDAFYRGCPELEQEILALSEDTGNGLYSRGVIHKRDKQYDGYLSLMKGAKESHMVAAVLIATVTFAAAFTLPGGYKNEEGKSQAMVIAFVAGIYAVLATSFWLAIVICFIGLSFFLCFLTVGYRMILHMMKGDKKMMYKMIELKLKIRKLKRKLKRKIGPIKDYLMRKLAIKTGA
ncbi:hypothetical protein EZV62_000780 [Acer yangbiense]|uniref:PGG domain-containing protein n=1 Tax=Acer yangbiense TaxID=1000413 RepID=A0A5C7ISH5_9ROSI|nr:hypothetical protein EZV62_000780 [Acer yangbiense]